MTTARQDEKSALKQETKAASAGADHSAGGSTCLIESALNRRGSDIPKRNTPQTPTRTPAIPLAGITENMMRHMRESSDKMKAAAGVKASSHEIDIVSLPEGGCDLVYSLPFPNETSPDTLPGKNKACYIITTDKKLYYANKSLKMLTPIKLESREFDLITSELSSHPRPRTEAGSFALWIEGLSACQLNQITASTKHIHGRSFYKYDNKKVVTQITESANSVEAANSTASQLLCSRLFPSCFAVHDNENRIIGVLSKGLPGFVPNRDKPLQPVDMQITSLRKMIKKRDEHDLEKLKEVAETIRAIIPLLERKPDAQRSYFVQAFQYAKNNVNYYVNTDGAQHVKPKLEEFIVSSNLPSITYGELENIRLLLIDRRQNIENVKKSYVSSQAKTHDIELAHLNKAIEQLNMILLDEIALFMKHMHDIDRQLQEAWVDVEAERLLPDSKYAHLEMVEGLLAPQHVSLDDLLHYRILTGQAKGLTQRYFGKDPDGHSRNQSSNGSGVDGDLADYPLTYRFRNLGRKPGANDFVLDLEDYINLPVLKKAVFRYWPTCAAIYDSTTDTALSITSDLTKNYYTSEDNKNYSNLEKSPVFNFQKYVQAIIISLMTPEIYTAIAKLHIPDRLPMLQHEGNTLTPLPLTTLTGERQDLQTKWIEDHVDRAIEAKARLTMQLQPVKMMLKRHSNLIIKLILCHFNEFLEDRRAELSPEAFKLLENALQPITITNAFHLLRKEVLSTESSLQSTKSGPGITLK